MEIIKGIMYTKKNQNKNNIYHKKIFKIFKTKS